MTASDLLQYMHVPVPRQETFPVLPSYRAYPVDLSRPETNEPLVDALAAGLSGRSIYAETDGWNAPYGEAIAGAAKSVWVRKTVLEKLLRINARLSEVSLELYLLDGYRTIECQWGIYNWMKTKIEQSHPNWSEAQIKAHLRNFISDPSTYNPADSTTWTSHITGGAIDLTLRHKPSGTLLEMGGVFDDPTELSFTDFYENLEHPLAESATFTEARRNRRLLYHIMRTEGFTSLPAEWWHYDFGDQLWARNYGNDLRGKATETVTAFYGPAAFAEE